MDDVFYMVLADGSCHTQYRHSTLESARTEAKRLAGLYLDKKFYVLAALGHMVKEDPVKWKVHGESGPTW